ncbi:hypothetical protein [Vallitalea okinawensis]|uniref:hypothetical protein n=1 Tax=Vallitalea okinawensis TaxID=2078660 RepID=UPI000CFD2F0D|nr:hypothetical protein [Vallitalea okinawensis]
MAKYEITLKTNSKGEKFLYCFGEGFFQMEDAQAYVDALKKEVSKVNPATTSLIIDSAESKPAAPDVVPLLVECTQIFHETPFKTKYYIKDKNIIATNQKKRTDDLGFFDSLTLIDSVDEVLK